jgi:hypothetical protein
MCELCDLRGSGVTEAIKLQQLGTERTSPRKNQLRALAIDLVKRGTDDLPQI